LVSFDLKHRHFDVATDHDPLSRAACQYQHGKLLGAAGYELH
jgi:hypothetical protein